MDSANDASVIYLPRTKAAPHALFGAARRLGGGSVWGGPPSLVLAKPYGESGKVDGALRPSSQGTRPGNAAALTREISRLLEEKEQRVKGQPPAPGESSG